MYLLLQKQRHERQNAYGRQLSSLHTVVTVGVIGKDVPMTFIRTPYIETVLSDACVPIASIDGHTVAAHQGNQLAVSFYLELNCDPKIHQFFLNMAQSYQDIRGWIFNG
jgi:5'-phosphate synthase pdxT subunit